jgi:hypothetical protein
MPSSTSSSERPANWRVGCWRLFKHLVLVGLAFLAVGEIWFRLPGTTKLVVWEFDEERVLRLAEHQRRGSGLGNFSTVSPPMGINSEGFRNGEIDWSAPTVLAVGSSELLGTGVEDSEVWTAITSKQLTASLGSTVTVVNAGCAGYGPYQQAVTVRRFLERHGAPRVIVVRVSLTDRRFVQPTPGQLQRARERNAFSSGIKRISEFLPFLVNRLSAQSAALRDTFTPDDDEATPAPVPDGRQLADEMWRQHSASWRQIKDMAVAAGVPVVFYVDAGEGGPSGNRLYELLSQEFRDEPRVVVTLFGPDSLGLSVENETERRRQYMEQFTLRSDPHSNARFHSLVAAFMTRKLAPLLSSAQRPSESVSDRSAAPQSRKITNRRAGSGRL